MATEEVAGIVGEAAASNDFLCVLQIYHAFGHLLVGKSLSVHKKPNLAAICEYALSRFCNSLAMLCIITRNVPVQN